MGQSTIGSICYGIKFEEGQEFPWDEEPFHGDIEAWWRSVNSYVNPCFNPFTSEGYFKAGITENDPRIRQYCAHQRIWMAANPVPIVLVNYCSAECPMYILAVPTTCNRCSVGEPLSICDFSPANTVGESSRLISFCDSYGIVKNNGIKPSDGNLPHPKWWLSSYQD